MCVRICTKSTKSMKQRTSETDTVKLVPAGLMDSCGGNVRGCDQSTEANVSSNTQIMKS